jgi:hypothetical protein
MLTHLLFIIYHSMQDGKMKSGKVEIWNPKYLLWHLNHINNKIAPSPYPAQIQVISGDITNCTDLKKQV